MGEKGYWHYFQASNNFTPTTMFIGVALFTTYKYFLTMHKAAQSWQCALCQTLSCPKSPSTPVQLSGDLLDHDSSYLDLLQTIEYFWLEF